MTWLLVSLVMLVSRLVQRCSYGRCLCWRWVCQECSIKVLGLETLLNKFCLSEAARAIVQAHQWVRNTLHRVKTLGAKQANEQRRKQASKQAISPPFVAQVQSGWRIEYCAASENRTNCPGHFDEFYKQRRRWIASTLANLMLIVKEWKYVHQLNHRVSVIFLVYQGLLLFSTLIGPSTVVLVVSGKERKLPSG